MVYKILTFLLIALYTIRQGQAQFWKLSGPSDTELFIMETRSLMPSGICYKELPAKAVDPELRKQLVSYCCTGYRQVANPRAMKCEPICTEDCSNGICSAPDVCECYPGYTRTNGRCESW